MTEKFSAARCERCGSQVGFEDGIRQDFCLCDPWCECCGRQFIPGGGTPRARATSPATPGSRICERCVEEKIGKDFSGEFLKSLSAAQMALLIRDISRRLEEES